MADISGPEITIDWVLGADAAIANLSR